MLQTHVSDSYFDAEFNAGLRDPTLVIVPRKRKERSAAKSPWAVPDIEKDTDEEEEEKEEEQPVASIVEPVSSSDGRCITKPGLGYCVDWTRLLNLVNAIL